MKPHNPEENLAVEKTLRISELEKVFRHTHVKRERDDICAQCGLDLRDTIHTRITGSADTRPERGGEG